MSIEAMKQALEALEAMNPYPASKEQLRFEAITALRQALAQPEQEPVARFNWNEAKFEWLTEYSYEKHHMKPLYLAPLKREWQGLTDNEIKKVFEADWNRPNCPEWVVEFSKKIEAKLKELNQ